MTLLSQNPIFIVGFPRSGTTLLQSMLAAQAGLYSFQETHFFTSTLRLIKTTNSGSVDLACLDTVIDDMKAKTEHHLSAATIDDLKDSAQARELSSKMIFESLVVELLKKQLPADQIGSVLWIEKTPGHIKHLATIQSFYPEVKFIEIVRFPLDAIFSYKLKLPDSYKHSFVELAHQWKSSIRSFAEFRMVNTKNSLTIKYEDLVADTEATLNSVSEFLDIKMTGIGADEIQATARRLVLKSESWKETNTEGGISKSKPGYKWKLSEKLKLSFILRDELTCFGYARKFGVVQKVYNSFMLFLNALSRFRLLSPFKRLAKSIIKKAGIWPYSDTEI